MLSPSDISLIEYKYNLAKEANNFSLFEQYLKEQIELSEKEFVANISWGKGDIRSIRPYYPESVVESAAFASAGGMEDRSTEEGWEILDCLLDIHTNEKNSKQYKEILMHVAGIVARIVGKERLLSFNNSDEFTETSLKIINDSAEFNTSWEGFQIENIMELLWKNLNSNRHTKNENAL